MATVPPTPRGRIVPYDPDVPADVAAAHTPPPDGRLSFADALAQMRLTPPPFGRSNTDAATGPPPPPSRNNNGSRRDLFPDAIHTQHHNLNHNHNHNHHHHHSPRPGRRVPGLRAGWQDDDDADACPICHTSFNFFFRRHHCRWCGIVVCSTCSAYRMTIPQSLALRPDSAPRVGANSGALPSSQNDNDDDNNNNDELEDVRVCVVCASASASSSLASPPPHFHSSSRPSRRRATAPSSVRSGFYRSSSNHSSASHTHNHTRSVDTRSFTSGRSFFDPSSYSHRIPFLCMSYGPATNTAATPSARPTRRESLSAGGAATSWIPNIGRYHPHTASAAAAVANPDPSAANQHQQHQQQHQQQQPRPRRIAEEDICPVCARQLPPKADDGDESAREAHISACIEECLHSSSTRPAQTQSTPPPPPPSSDNHTGSPQEQSSGSGRSQYHGTTTVRSDSSAQSQPQSNSNNNTTQPSLPRTQLGYLVVSEYPATHRDCLTSEGVPFECDICMEEFEQAQPMVLLNCLCRFHKHCLTDWFDQSRHLARPGGPREGQRPGCPTHAHCMVG